MDARITTQALFDPASCTFTYLVADQASGHAAIIDPVLDFDFKSGRTGTASAERVLASTFMRASRKTSSSACAPPGMPRWACRP